MFAPVQVAHVDARCKGFLDFVATLLPSAEYNLNVNIASVF